MSGRRTSDEDAGDGTEGGQPSQETLTRNWDELLQEIRVTQTGVQILTGFLLTVPFSPRFGDLTGFQKGLYLAVLGGAVMTTGLVVAPVAFHRALFRRRRRELLVDAGNRFAILGLAMLGLTVSGVVMLVVDVVVGAAESYVAGAVALAVLAALWGLLPHLADRVDDTPRNPPPDADREPDA